MELVARAKRGDSLVGSARYRPELLEVGKGGRVAQQLFVHDHRQMQVENDSIVDGKAQDLVHDDIVRQFVCVCCVALRCVVCHFVCMRTMPMSWYCFSVSNEEGLNQTRRVSSSYENMPGRQRHPKVSALSHARVHDTTQGWS